MLAITHFAVGAALTFAVFGLFIEERYWPLLMLSGGIFAMFPDVAHMFPAFSVLHDTMLSNVFFGHGLMDAWETAHPQGEGTIAVLYLVFVTLIVTGKAGEQA